MNRSYGPPPSRNPSAQQDRYEDWGGPRGAEPWQDDRESQQGRAGAMDRQSRPGPENEGHPGTGNRQFGEHEGETGGQFGEGEIGSSGMQWNDDDQDRGADRGCAPGYEEGGRQRTLWQEGAGCGMSGNDVRRAGPKGYTRSDERIRDDVCEHLCRNHSVDVQDVSVEVKDGTVCLEGIVPERAMKHRIEDIVEGSIGVKDIDNRIRVSHSGTSGSGGSSIGKG